MCRPFLTEGCSCEGGYRIRAGNGGTGGIMMRLPRACCLAGGDDLLMTELMEGTGDSSLLS